MTELYTTEALDRVPTEEAGPGDIVALQVPNWWEFVVTSLACGRIGAVVNPLMPIFRERELDREDASNQCAVPDSMTCCHGNTPATAITRRKINADAFNRRLD